jgi:hypothetical protein
MQAPELLEKSLKEFWPAIRAGETESKREAMRRAMFYSVG